jgi:hypothetical protein
MRTQMSALLQSARAHPRCCLAVLSRAQTSKTALQALEAALASMRVAGFAGPEAVRLVRALGAYLVGSLEREVGVAPDPGGRDAGGERRSARVAAAMFPHIADLHAELASSDPDADFEFGLDLLLQARPGGV